MKALMSSWPRRGSCSEYFSSMSGDAMSSTTLRLTFSPQKSVNHRTTTALLSSSLLIWNLLNGPVRTTDIGRWPGQRGRPIEWDPNSGSYPAIAGVRPGRGQGANQHGQASRPAPPPGHPEGALE